MQFRYTGIHLSAPEQVRYSYRLEGLDPDWVTAGSRRVINYNSLPHGQYRFVVRASCPAGPASETSLRFEVLPHFYETAWFRLAVRGHVCWPRRGRVYQLRLRQIRYRFAVVLEERARLAREIHDTLAQGFVRHLVATGCRSHGHAGRALRPARKYLDMARRMARHSLTEARRSVMDLRAAVLEGQDLAAALESGTRMWTAGSGVESMWMSAVAQAELPEEMEQHLLRIAQEAVTNVLKHAGASRIGIKLHTEARKLYLRIVDNGRGFDQPGVFSSLGRAFRSDRNARAGRAPGRRTAPGKPPRRRDGSGSDGTVAMSDPIRILVAEDHLVARVGVSAIVGMQPDMTIVAEASNGQQAVELYRQHLPDVTLLDLRMPVMGGVEAAQASAPNFRMRG